MRATIIFEDMRVTVDGEVKLLQSMPQHDPNWKVIQWHGDHGWIEVHSGDRIWLTDSKLLLPFISAYDSTVVDTPDDDPVQAD